MNCISFTSCLDGETKVNFEAFPVFRTYGELKNLVTYYGSYEGSRFKSNDIAQKHVYLTIYTNKITYSCYDLETEELESIEVFDLVHISVGEVFINSEYIYGSNGCKTRVNGFNVIAPEE